MNKQIRRLGIFLIICYIALFVKLNQVQIFQADELANNPSNRAVVKREYNRPRGAITSADGALLAQSVQVDGETTRRQRVYPERELFGQVTGYFSLTYGATGVENTYGDVLSASTVAQQIDSLGDLFSNKEQVGNVELSVRKDLQEIARQQLKNPVTGEDRQGSVVAIDPRTGEILTFWSYPSFDPNLLSVGTYDEQKVAWDVLNAAPGKPLQAKQYQERYFPGSTFKVVTSAIGLQTGKVTNELPVYPTASSYLPPGTATPIKNFAGEICGGTLPQVLTVSCNSAYAEMGQKTIGAADMIRGSEDWGFNKTPEIDLPSAAPSAFPTDVAKDPPKLAQASIGQNDVQATPLQMALVTAGVANKGVIMRPHVMRQVKNSDGRVVKTYEPQPWLQPMDDIQAEILHEDMLGPVNDPNGTGVSARIPGYEVAGKTGTAQTGTGQVHTWFIAMAGPIGADPEVAIAVVVLNQPGVNDITGGAVAGPIAREVMKAALESTSATSGAGPGTSTSVPDGNGQGGQTGQDGNGNGPPSTAPKRDTTTSSAPVSTSSSTPVSATSTTGAPPRPPGSTP